MTTIENAIRFINLLQAMFQQTCACEQIHSSHLCSFDTLQCPVFTRMPIQTFAIQLFKRLLNCRRRQVVERLHIVGRQFKIKPGCLLQYIMRGFTRIWACTRLHAQETENSSHRLVVLMASHVEHSRILKRFSVAETPAGLQHDVIVTNLHREGCKEGRCGWIQTAW